jgi:hypothetical protein
MVLQPLHHQLSHWFQLQRLMYRQQFHPHPELIRLTHQYCYQDLRQHMKLAEKLTWKKQEKKPGLYFRMPNGIPK